MCVEGVCEKKPKTFVNNRLLLQHKKDHENLPFHEIVTGNVSISRSSKEWQRHINYEPAQQVDLQELMSLSTFDLKGAVVNPLELDPLTTS